MNPSFLGNSAKNSSARVVAGTGAASASNGAFKPATRQVTSRIDTGLARQRPHSARQEPPRVPSHDARPEKAKSASFNPRPPPPSRQAVSRQPPPQFARHSQLNSSMSDSFSRSHLSKSLNSSTSRSRSGSQHRVVIQSKKTFSQGPQQPSQPPSRPASPRWNSGLRIDKNVYIEKVSALDPPPSSFPVGRLMRGSGYGSGTPAGGSAKGVLWDRGEIRNLNRPQSPSLNRSGSLSRSSQNRSFSSVNNSVNNSTTSVRAGGRKKATKVGGPNRSLNTSGNGLTQIGAARGRPGGAKNPVMVLKPSSKQQQSGARDRDYRSNTSSRLVNQRSVKGFPDRDFRNPALTDRKPPHCNADKTSYSTTRKAAPKKTASRPLLNRLDSDDAPYYGKTDSSKPHRLALAGCTASNVAIAAALGDGVVYADAARQNRETSATYERRHSASSSSGDKENRYSGEPQVAQFSRSKAVSSPPDTSNPARVSLPLRGRTSDALSIKAPSTGGLSVCRNSRDSVEPPSKLRQPSLTARNSPQCLPENGLDHILSPSSLGVPEAF